jgi:hypothetical protein
LFDSDESDSKKNKTLLYIKTKSMSNMKPEDTIETYQDVIAQHCWMSRKATVIRDYEKFESSKARNNQ